MTKLLTHKREEIWNASRVSNIGQKCEERMKKLLILALINLAMSTISFAGEYLGIECTSGEIKVRVEFLGRDDNKGDRATINGKEEPVIDIGSNSTTERYETPSKRFKVSYDTKSGLGTMKLDSKLYSVECVEI